MAIAVRTERARVDQRGRGAMAVPVQGVGRAGSRAGSPQARAAQRPTLTVVPRRRAARSIIVLWVLAALLMAGAAAFQTQLARRQVTLDILDSHIRAAHDDYDVLRRERAELRSPGRLVEQAALLGMRPAESTEFISIAPDVIAEVQRSGVPGGGGSAGLVDEFADFAAVKSEAGRAP
ncbi:MAG: hypothetical protein ACKO27_02965 [Ilumatobacteraceae bacterium]